MYILFYILLSNFLIKFLNLNILQAVNYDKDESNNYWVVLDIGIPLNATIENNRLFENLSIVEIDIISTILTCK